MFEINVQEVHKINPNILTTIRMTRVTVKVKAIAPTAKKMYSYQSAS